MQTGPLFTLLSASRDRHSTEKTQPSLDTTVSRPAKDNVVNSAAENREPRLPRAPGKSPWDGRGCPFAGQWR